MLIDFKCNNPDCVNSINKFFKPGAKIPPFLDCGECGTGKLERQLGAPSTSSTQIIDNGVQARQVEVSSEVVLKEQERLYREDD
jgi:hypothetical protein